MVLAMKFMNKPHFFPFILSYTVFEIFHYFRGCVAIVMYIYSKVEFPIVDALKYGQLLYKDTA